MIRLFLPDRDAVYLDAGTRLVVANEGGDQTITMGEIGLVGLYDVQCAVLDGTLGDGVNAKILRFSDPGTGLTIDVPIPDATAAKIGKDLRPRRWKAPKR